MSLPTLFRRIEYSTKPVAAVALSMGVFLFCRTIVGSVVDTVSVRTVWVNRYLVVTTKIIFSIISNIANISIDKKEKSFYHKRKPRQEGSDA